MIVVKIVDAYIKTKILILMLITLINYMHRSVVKLNIVYRAIILHDIAMA